MNRCTVNGLRLLSGSVLLTALLTACPGPTPPPPLPGVNLTFSYPVGADTSGLTLAAIYYVGPNPADLKVLPTSGYGGPGGAGTSLGLDGYSLQKLAADPKCLTSFKDGEAKGMNEVIVTPTDVKTCNIYFLAFRDANGDRLPQKTEEVYITHDVLSNASAAFSYGYLSPDGKSRETGTRKAGWTLVRHVVLQPDATPGQYLVSMNSVLAADQAIPIPLHEPSTYFSSMSLPLAGGSK